MLLSRWFSWTANWQKFSQAWTFLARVHAFRKTQSGQVLRPESSEQEDDLNVLSDAAKQADGKGNLRALLQSMLSSQSALDVAFDVLHDRGLRKLAWMFLGREPKTSQVRLWICELCADLSVTEAVS